MARVPLAACGILGLAATLDKDIAKQLLQAAGLPVARSVTIHQDAPPALERGDAVDGRVDRSCPRWHPSVSADHWTPAVGPRLR